MTTICGKCGRELNESTNEDRFIMCKLCNRYTARGANSVNKLTGGKKMTNNEKKKIAGYTLTCRGCGVVKKTNYLQYMKKKEAKTLGNHYCRKCRKKQKKE